MFTSGGTGDPTPHAKHWGSLSDAAALPLLRTLAAQGGTVDLPYHGGRTVRATVRAAET